MLTALNIAGFRSFKALRVNGLARVNLFVGANNAGKTSLLEAIEILAIGRPWGLFRSPARRGEEAARWSGDERFGGGPPDLDLSHLFYGHALRGGVFTIESIGGTRRFVECACFAIVLDADAAVGQPKLPSLDTAGSSMAISFKSDSVSSPVILALSQGDGLSWEVRRRYSVSAQEDISPVNFVRPDEPSSLHLTAMWDRVVLTPEEEQVVEALKIIEPRIERIAFVGEERRSTRRILLKLSDSEHRLPLGSVGDGLKRLLGLSLNLLPAKKGVLLVDEIDTGLHFSVMADMWKMIIETAIRLDVQVFATTHSLDCVHALAWVREKLPEQQFQVMLHRVERGLDRTVSYTLEEVATAAKNHIEVR